MKKIRYCILAIAIFGLAEISGWLLLDQGQELMRTNFKGFILLMIATCTTLPLGITMLVILWFAEKNLLRFSLIAVVATTTGASLVAAAITSGFLLSGKAFIDVGWGYLPLLCSYACLYAWNKLEPTNF